MSPRQAAETARSFMVRIVCTIRAARRKGFFMIISNTFSGHSTKYSIGLTLGSVPELMPQSKLRKDTSGLAFG